MKKLNNIHKLLTTGAGILCIAFFFSSCLKSRMGETDFNALQPVVLIPEGGLGAFSTEALTFPSSDPFDTSFFHINYAATNVASANETVTLAIDQTALQTYNTNNPTQQYQLFPDSIFSFSTTSVTIPKGDNYSTAIPLVVYPDKIDPTQSYMLPISIKTVPTGSTLSGNFGTIWYHVIGNPIAGAYNDEWIRYNTATQTGSPAFDNNYPGTIFSPNSPTEIEVPSSGTGVDYIVDFTNNGGTLSNFTISFDAGSVKTANITITGGPTIVTADPVNGVYKFNFTYNNSTGSPRNITDIYTK
jgi:Domain of unknown function (DUF1735)